MKIFSFLLSIYIFCLAILPCSDIHLVLNEVEHSAAYHSDQESHDHDHGQNKDTHCSPFCTCTCCHSPMNFEFVHNYIDPVLLHVPVSTDDNTFLYYDSPSSTYLNSIWQPPKSNA